MDFSAVKDKLNKLKGSFLLTLKHMDYKALGIGFALCVSVYVALFSYVSIQANATITALNSQLYQQSFPIDDPQERFTKQKAEESVLDKDLMISGLYEKTDHGLLPVIRKDLLTSFRAYQSTVDLEKLPKDRPFISFMILDYGLSDTGSEDILSSLPPNLSLMLSPYAMRPKSWVQKARNKGFEVWLDIPLQNMHKHDQGKYSLLHHAGLEAKADALYKSLSSAIGYIGLGVYTDQSFDYAKDDYMQVVDEVYNRGLGLFEKNPDVKSSIRGKAFAMGAPYIQADIMAYQTIGENSFDEASQIAKSRGYAVVVVPDYPKTIKNLAAWCKNIGATEFNIVPVSAIYDVPAFLAKSEGHQEVSPHSLKQIDLQEPEEHSSEHH